MKEQGADLAYGLSPEDLRHYQEQGFVQPRELCTPDEISQLRSDFEQSVLADGRGPTMRHLDHRPVYDLCCRSTLLDPIASILGPDLIIWRSRFIIKAPGAKQIPWHQDAAYYPRHLEPLINVSAWIALDDVDDGNACVRLIPGSHKAAVPHLKASADADAGFGLQADPRRINARDAVAMTMKAGEFFLFDVGILHGSTANSSNRYRAGLSVRVTVPSVKITPGPAERALLVRGADRFGLNHLARPPQDWIAIEP
jgi:non-heme Fe2+,alpha-ketoglutarate-dependent halogenase